MTMIKTKIIIAAAMTATMAAPLLAQDGIRALNGYGQNETRTMLSLSVPFGGQREEAMPRIELNIQNINGQSSLAPSTYVTSFDRIRSENTIGFRLNNEPTLMLNGRPFKPVDNQQNLSTGAGIALGLGLLAGAILVATAETADEISDLVDPD
ncbi:MAG: hypothetical protein ABJO01_11195 [Parasphingorhabdus sp.]|uniref:hypothetical protein n=1 Tax=Parasphingorhabdus sp. TaxID=2709688 RepID=UPI003298010D